MKVCLACEPRYQMFTVMLEWTFEPMSQRHLDRISSQTTDKVLGMSDWNFRGELLCVQTIFMMFQLSFAGYTFGHKKEVLRARAISKDQTKGDVVNYVLANLVCMLLTKSQRHRYTSIFILAGDGHTG